LSFLKKKQLKKLVDFIQIHENTKTHTKIACTKKTFGWRMLLTFLNFFKNKQII